MFAILMPLLRLSITNAPRIAPKMLPRPPIKLAPPMTHAAMASNSNSRPASGLALPTRAVMTIPATAIKAPIVANTRNVILRTLTPERYAASAFPPTAYT